MPGPDHHTVAKEPKDKVRYRERTVRRGGRLIGHIRAYKRVPGMPTLTIYWAIKRTDEFFVADNAWAFDMTTMQAVAPYSCSHIGIEVEDGTRLLVPRAWLVNAELRAQHGITMTNESRTVPGMKGPLRYYVPLSVFAKSEPPPEERERLVERMHVKNTRRTAPTRIPVAA